VGLARIIYVTTAQTVDGADKGVGYLGIKMAAPSRFDNTQRFPEGAGLSIISPPGGDGVEYVGQGHESAFQGDVFAGKPPGVA
jgi:hypothetical protein